jgi:hypothetical protein
MAMVNIVCFAEDFGGKAYSHFCALMLCSVMILEAPIMIVKYLRKIL